MRNQRQKRLLKPTLLAQTSIKSELQISKFILTSQIQPLLQPTLLKNKQLKERLLNLQWKYLQQSNKAIKLNTLNHKIQEQYCLKEKNSQQAEKLKKQIYAINHKNQCIKAKFNDRSLSLVEDSQYLNRLREQQMNKKAQTSKIDKQNSTLENRIKKMDFVLTQLTNQHSTSKQMHWNCLSKEKLNIKESLKLKLQGIKSKIFQTRTKLQIEQQKLKNNQDGINFLDKKLMKIVQKFESSSKQLIKLQAKLTDQNNIKSELTSKLGALKCSLDKLISMNKMLEKSKQTFVEITRELIEQNLAFESALRNLQQATIFQMQHCARILGTAIESEYA